MPIPELLVIRGVTVYHFSKTKECFEPKQGIWLNRGLVSILLFETICGKAKGSWQIKINRFCNKKIATKDSTQF